jgi:uncharacterized protein YyaL (SSP411 family)
MPVAHFAFKSVTSAGYLHVNPEFRVISVATNETQGAELKPSNLYRIVRKACFGQSLRQSYWDFSALAGEVRRLFQPKNQGFRGEVVRNQWRFLTGAVVPTRGESEARAELAVRWLLQAQEVTTDDGVALGYFPCNPDGTSWRASYPETTGYIITSLLNYARRNQDDRIAMAALRMAEWEVAVQMPNGAVQGGPVSAPEHQTAAAFNTGMVLDGWCSAAAHSGSPTLLEAARRAADFLVDDIDERGYFKTNGAFVTAGEIKTYTCLCAWAIYRFGDLVNEDRYRQAAVAVIESAIRQQQPNGWFAHNCLNRSEAPLTHTIGYTLQGVLEVGILAGRADFIAAVRRTLEAVMPRISPNGFLAGRFFDDWEPAVFSSCLTGSAQIAIVLYRLAEHDGEVRYRECADKLVDYLKSLQLSSSEDPAVVGALAGSFPLFGGYMRAGYPNWATKYLLDAMMLQSR